MIGEKQRSGCSSENEWETLDRFAFGDEPVLADRLLDLVLRGMKTATCWSVEEGKQTEVGCRSVVCDGSDRPRAVLETISIEQVAFDQVNQDFAAREGEGDLSLGNWRTSHREFRAGRSLSPWHVAVVRNISVDLDNRNAALFR
jgi:uncharacterized protein YhfF